MPLPQLLRLLRQQRVRNRLLELLVDEPAQVELAAEAEGEAAAEALVAEAEKLREAKEAAAARKRGRKFSEKVKSPRSFLANPPSSCRAKSSRSRMGG